MCNWECRKAHIKQQIDLLEQIRVLSNEVKAWRSTSSVSHRESLQEFMRSTDLCGWKTSLETGILGFPLFPKRFWDKLLDLFKF
jgi:hypothetical protein